MPIHLSPALREAVLAAAGRALADQAAGSFNERADAIIMEMVKDGVVDLEERADEVLKAEVEKNYDLKELVRETVRDVVERDVDVEGAFDDAKGDIERELRKEAENVDLDEVAKDILSEAVADDLQKVASSLLADGGKDAVVKAAGEILAERVANEENLARVEFTEAPVCPACQNPDPHASAIKAILEGAPAGEPPVQPAPAKLDPAHVLREVHRQMYTHGNMRVIPDDAWSLIIRYLSEG